MQCHLLKTDSVHNSPHCIILLYKLAAVRGPMQNLHQYGCTCTQTLQTFCSEQVEPRLASLLHLPHSLQTLTTEALQLLHGRGSTVSCYKTYVVALFSTMQPWHVQYIQPCWCHAKTHSCVPIQHWRQRQVHICFARQ